MKNIYNGSVTIDLNSLGESKEEAEKTINDFLDWLDVKTTENNIVKYDSTDYKIEKSTEQVWEIGTILHASWGYDQTDVDWFQVTKVKGKSIWLRPIRENSSDAGNCSYGYTQPRRNEFNGVEFRKTVQPNGYVCSPLRGYLRKWDGKPQYCSSYH